MQLICGVKRIKKAILLSFPELSNERPKIKKKTVCQNKEV